METSCRVPACRLRGTRCRSRTGRLLRVEQASHQRDLPGMRWSTRRESNPPIPGWKPRLPPLGSRVHGAPHRIEAILPAYKAGLGAYAGHEVEPGPGVEPDRRPYQGHQRADDSPGERGAGGGSRTHMNARTKGVPVRRRRQDGAGDGGRTRPSRNGVPSSHQRDRTCMKWSGWLESNQPLPASQTGRTPRALTPRDGRSRRNRTSCKPGMNRSPLHPGLLRVNVGESGIEPDRREGQILAEVPSPTPRGDDRGGRIRTCGLPVPNGAR